jgi:hypothetical protein
MTHLILTVGTGTAGAHSTQQSTIRTSKGETKNVRIPNPKISRSVHAAQSQGNSQKKYLIEQYWS